MDRKQVSNLKGARRAEHLAAATFMCCVMLVVQFVVPALAHSPGTGYRLVGGSSYCDGVGLPAFGEGDGSQAKVHSQVFNPAFQTECLDADSTFNFLPTGGQQAFLSLLIRSRDFGATDVPLTPVQKTMVERDLKTLQNRIGELHHFPLFLDSVAVGFRLSDECLPPKSRLKLRSKILSDIFSGIIVSWNHPALIADNPSLVNCNEPISLVKSSGYAGTTFNFKDYLSKRNPQWMYYKQTDQNTVWPQEATFACTGLDDFGNADCILGNPASIGYVHFGAARARQVKLALVENLDGQFVEPSPSACQTAAAGIITTADIERFDIFGLFPGGTGGDWSTVSLTDSRTGYPICNFGYALVLNTRFSAYADGAVGVIRTTVDYLLTAVEISRNPTLNYRLTDAGFAPLPLPLANMVEFGIESLRMY